MKLIIGMLALIALSGCQQRVAQNVSVANDVTPMNTVQAASEANETANVVEPDRAPLIEPKRPIDPKSAEAAGQVLQHYGALIEKGRWKEAANYWGDGGAAAAFQNELQSLRLKHLQVGKPGELEGAAGSIYITVFVSFYGPDTKWGPSGRDAKVILRRANDVPGSTEAQRRWHIERIEWLPMA
jgi:hypothetical protein